MPDDVAVLGGRLKLHQIEGALKTSTDSLLLAAACPAKTGDHVLDLGCGIGSVGLGVFTRQPHIKLTGLDIQADHVELARHNAKINGYEKFSNFIHDDVRNYENRIYDHVVCNPPYEESGHYIISPHKKRAVALGHQNHQEKIELKDWVKAAYNNLKSGGSLTLIHKADRLQAIIVAMGKAWGGIEIIPIYSKPSQKAKRVIVRARKQSKSVSRIHEGLILHDENGGYSKAAEKILREGGGLFITEP